MRVAEVEVRRPSIGVLAGHVVLAGLLFPVLLLAWVFLAAIAGDESFTEDVIHGGIVGTAVVAGAGILFVAIRWGIRAGSRWVAAVVATSAGLALVGAAAAALLDFVGHSPLNLSPPRIVGTARVGETLTVLPGRWDPRRSEPLEFEYSWFRCRGGNCVDLFASGRRYRVRAADVGARLSSSVLAIGDLNASVDSQETEVVRP
jgi:hypothetical protein